MQLVPKYNGLTCKISEVSCDYVSDAYFLFVYFYTKLKPIYGSYVRCIF